VTSYVYHLVWFSVPMLSKNCKHPPGTLRARTFWRKKLDKLFCVLYSLSNVKVQGTVTAVWNLLIFIHYQNEMCKVMLCGM